MNLVKWDPFRELEGIQARLNHLFSDAPSRAFDDDRFFANWTPPVDIQETEKEYIVKADLPDVKKDDVKVELDGDMLTVEGERKQEKEEKTKRFHRTERAYGKFVRRFRSIEAALGKDGRKPEDATLEEMDQLWDEAKAAEKDS